MKKLFISIGFLALGFGHMAHAEKPRNFACDFSFQTDQYTRTIPGKTIVINQDVIERNIKAANSSQKISLHDENRYVSTDFNASVGPECAVEEAAGCQSAHDGALTYRYEISLTDKSSGKKAVMTGMIYSTDVIASAFPTLSITPINDIKDEKGKSIILLSTQCEDVAYSSLR
jgi:hypothetical protein